MSQPTCWRGESGRSGLVSSEMWHIANEDSLPGGGEEGGKGWGAWKRGTLQKGDDLTGGGRGGGGGRGRGRKEGRIAETKDEEEGGGRSGLVSLEMWHVTNEDSLTGGRKEGGVGR